jgi:hypothetical protein
MLATSPSNVATVNPAHSASAASSVKSALASRAARRWASRITSYRNDCGVCAMRSRARSGVASTLPVSPISLMVSATGIAGIAAPVRLAASIAREMSAAETNGRAASWIRTMSGFSAASASSPACTEAWRVAPPLAGGRWRNPLVAALNMAMSSGLSTGCTAKISPWRQNGSMARNITVCPPIERYCLGPPVPARRPRPAATRMAAVRSDFAMGQRWDSDTGENGG